MSTAALNAALSGLAGGLCLQPGAPPGHSLRSTRPRHPARLLVGQPAADAPALLASLFSLCGPVHRLCAQLALRAIDQQALVAPSAAERRLLQWHTLREHVMRISLDWPRQLTAGQQGQAAATEAGLALLAGCPLLGAAPQDEAAWAQRLQTTTAWLAQQVFRQPLADWLADWQAAPEVALAGWCAQQAATHPLAAWLQAVRSLASQPLPSVPALRPPAGPHTLQALVTDLRAQAAGRAAPQWQGRCAETGPWARLHAVDGQPALTTPWLRLGARLADLARLALPAPAAPRPGDTLLGMAAQPLAGSAGPAAVAWVETARGLLIHALWLTPAPDADQPARLADLLVLAPTDWNSHPQGGWAQALSALPADAPSAAVQALVAAYDPCVPCDLASCAPQAPHSTEAGHA